MTDSRITLDRDGQVLLIGFNRPEKRNATDLQMLQELSLAYGELERDPELRAGFVYAHGDHFTGGLDLADIGPRIDANGIDIVPEGGINPWQVSGTQLSKPVVIAVQGICLTLGIELILASDIAVAAESTSFAQIEVARGILPFGGATIRFPRAASSTPAAWNSPSGSPPRPRWPCRPHSPTHGPRCATGTPRPKRSCSPSS
jgi:enoyl-CoA hydratase